MGKRARTPGACSFRARALAATGQKFPASVVTDLLSLESRRWTRCRQSRSQCRAEDSARGADGHATKQKSRAAGRHCQIVVVSRDDHLNLDSCVMGMELLRLVTLNH